MAKDKARRHLPLEISATKAKTEQKGVTPIHEMVGLKEGKTGNIKIENNDHDTIQDLMGGLNER